MQRHIMMFSVFLLVTLGLVGCNLLGGNFEFDEYANDTLEQEYADEWRTESADLTFVLKDNTFLLDEGAEGPVTTGTVTRGFNNTLRLQTSLMYLEEEDFASIEESLDFSEISAAADLLSLYSGTPFVPPQSAFTFDEWVTEKEFTEQYEETAEAYTEAYLAYIEQVYADLGYDIDSLIFGWNTLKKEMIDSTEVDPTTLEGYYEEPKMNYEVTNTGDDRNLVFQGDPLAGESNRSFVSDIPTKVNYTGP